MLRCVTCGMIALRIAQMPPHALTPPTRTCAVLLVWCRATVVLGRKLPSSSVCVGVCVVVTLCVSLSVFVRTNVCVCLGMCIV